MSRYHNTHESSGDYYRFPARQLPVNITRSSRDSTRNYPIAQRDTHASPNRESEADRLHPPRRRIAVACSRCRKRKIKCSGDVGAGGCVSCKNAGTDPSSCQFLRVNSDSIHCPIPSGIEWPYPNGAGNPSLGPHYNATLGQYSLPSSSAYLGSPALARGFSTGPYSTSLYSSVPQKDYGGNYSTNSNDSVFDTYGIQSPQYLHHPPDSQVSTTNYEPAEATRHWQSSGSLNRCSINYDPDLLNRYPTTTTPYNPTLMSSTVNLSDTPVFPGMSSMANSLPATIPPLSSDRVLPNPRASITQADNSQLHPSLHDISFPFLLPKSSSTTPWGSDRMTTGTSDTSTSTASSSNGPNTLLAVPSSKSSASPPDSQDQTYGYLQVNSPSTIAANPANDYVLTSTAVDASTPGYADALPRGTQQYTYSLSVQGKRDGTVDGSATLLNGQPYTTLRNAQGRAAGAGFTSGRIDEVVRGRTTVASGGRR